jgi:type VI secretion system protein ImpC
MGKWSLDGAQVGMESSEQAAEVDEQQPLKIVVIGDFSGRGSQRNAKPRGSGAIRALLIDRDNFEQVLQHLNVRLDEMPIQPSGALGSVAIDSLDDFHPDSLLQRVATFRALRELRSRLAKRETFADAMEEARGLLQPPREVPAETRAESPAANSSAANEGGSLLDQILDVAESNAPPPPRRLNDIERFAQAMMAPYSIPADDPRQEPWLEAADQAAAFAVKQLLQNNRFRELEARWRSLDWLTRRIDSDVAVKVAVIDLSEQELRADLDRDNLAESALYELLVTRPQLQPDKKGWGVIVLDQRLGGEIADIELLGRLSQIAADSKAKLLVGLSDDAVGCTRGKDPFTASELAEASVGWQALQQLPDTQHTSAIWPGFILRQPYGKQTSEVESLEFEELSGVDPQQALLVGNGAYLAAAQLVRGHEEDSSNDYTGLPCVVLKDQAGQKLMVPASGWWLRDSALEHLSSLGITVAFSLPHAGALRLFPLRNLSNSEVL